MKTRFVVSIFALALCCAPQASAVDYEYDALGRLTKADYGDGKIIEYSYDAAGNRTSVIVTEASTPPSSQDQTNMTVVPMGGSFVLIPEEDE